MDIITNAERVPQKINQAQKIIIELQQELLQRIEDGAGPFLAAIYDDKDNLIAKAANSVINENCSHNHAEMNVIKTAEHALGTYDLSSYICACM